MLYNSFSFLLFFPVAIGLYYTLPHKVRWVYLLVVSYLFYANWNPAYLIILVTTTCFTYCCARLIGERFHNNWMLALSITLSFSGLFVYKYLNFFNETIFGLLNLCGLRLAVPKFELLLPIGISFYTFMAVGYLIDVYRGKIKPEKNIAKYALFVSFFPQIAAGPIGRAGDLMPQFEERHPFKKENLSAGLRMMLWGYFMKVVVADRLALYTGAVFGNLYHHSGITILLAAVFFSIQIYCDFAGYSYLAWGTAKAMGFNLIMNFERPYMARSVTEFWRRWHISLSTWFRDYVYFPLGGNRCGKWRNRFNLMVTFLVSGLWHGANWTFVVWGGLNGAFQVVGKALPSFKISSNKHIERLHRLYDVAVTFLLMTIAWVFFKSNTISDACHAVSAMLIPTGKLYVPQLSVLVYCLIGLVLLILTDVLWEIKGRHPFLENRSMAVRFASYVSFAMMILVMGVFDGGQFIYFQF